RTPPPARGLPPASRPRGGAGGRGAAPPPHPARAVDEPGRPVRASAASHPPAGEEPGAAIEVTAGGQGDADGVRGPAVGGTRCAALRRADEQPRIVAADRARPAHDPVPAGPPSIHPGPGGGARKPPPAPPPRHHAALHPPPP